MIGLAARMGAIQASGGFDPSMVAGLWGWWKADALALSDGAAIASWSDSSGNGRTMTQASGTKQPLYRAAPTGFNGKPAVQFDGSNDELGTAAVAFAASALTMFVVYRVPDTSNYNAMLTKTNGNSPAPFDAYQIQGGTPVRYFAGGGPVDGPNSSVGATNVHEVGYSGSTATVYDNGTAGSPQTGRALTGDNAAKPILLGARDDGVTRMKGHVAEALLYDVAVSSTDRSLIRAYLGAKYGVTVS